MPLFEDEINSFLPRLALGGIMFVHDTTIYHLRRYSQWKHIEFLDKANSHYLFTWPYTAGQCGLTMIMKRDITPFLRSEQR